MDKYLLYLRCDPLRDRQMPFSSVPNWPLQAAFICYHIYFKEKKTAWVFFSWIQFWNSDSILFLFASPNGQFMSQARLIITNFGVIPRFSARLLAVKSHWTQCIYSQGRMTELHQYYSSCREFTRYHSFMLSLVCCAFDSLEFQFN